MNHLRTYGVAPYTVAVIHGGPGAGGELAPVARRLSKAWGVIEPIQTATSVDGQIEELRVVLEEQRNRPIVWVGYSWGAWLAMLTAARYPALCERLILVSSGPFEVSYVKKLRETRMGRLSDRERAEFGMLMDRLNGATGDDRDRAMARLGELVSKSDDYDPIPGDRRRSDAVDVSGDIFQRVWAEAAEMRKNGDLLRAAGQVGCPVVAIHGDHDPHPAAGVERPLAGILDDFRFFLVEKCGHTPWIERHASEGFYALLGEAIDGSSLRERK